MLALYSEQELNTIILISSKDGEERVELPSVVVGVHRDDPVVCVIQHRLISHLLQQVFWKARKEFTLQVYKWHFHLHGAALEVDRILGEGTSVVIVCQVMDHFESLADAEDGPVNFSFIFLFLHIFPNTLRCFVEHRVLPCLHVDQWGVTASEKDAINLSKQLLEILVLQIIANRHSPVASIVYEIHICLPTELRVVERIRAHQLIEEWRNSDTPHWLCLLEALLEVEIGVVLVPRVNHHLQYIIRCVDLIQ